MHWSGQFRFLLPHSHVQPQTCQTILLQIVLRVQINWVKFDFLLLFFLPRASLVVLLRLTLDAQSVFVVGDVEVEALGGDEVVLEALIVLLLVLFPGLVLEFEDLDVDLVGYILGMYISNFFFLIKNINP